MLLSFSNSCHGTPCIFPGCPGLYSFIRIKNLILFIKSCNGQTSQIKNSKILIVIFRLISNESFEPLHLQREIKYNLNVMVYCVLVSCALIGCKFMSGATGQVSSS